MNDINTISGLPSTATLREFMNQATPSGKEAGDEQGGDQVEISELAKFLSRVAELPDVRVEKVATVRLALARGEYESSEKLDKAVEGVLSELTSSSA